MQIRKIHKKGFLGLTMVQFVKLMVIASTAIVLFYIIINTFGNKSALIT